ncbi:cas scaffolding protein family member 4 [Silurus meridionalis]|nr:cas scaffolding protein family member 4 [Silurus meridionalis]
MTVTGDDKKTIFAKALYDNTAESPDELAFHKGDVVVVIEQTVEGSVGWWKCSLHGREGLAPANRLRLLSPSESIYQIPRPSEASPTYEVMEHFYKVPSTNMVHSPVLFPQKSKTLERHTSLNKVVKDDRSSPGADMYAVPMVGRKGYLYTIYAVPPTPSKEPNYDIPVPSKKEIQLNLGSSYSTLLNPQKFEQIYDVPVAPEKPSSGCGFYSTVPSKGAHCEKELYDTLPTCVRLATVPSRLLYDIPKCSEQAQQKGDSIPPSKESIYDVPPSIHQKETIMNGLMLSNEKDVNPVDSENVSKPLEYRVSKPLECKPAQRPGHPHGCSPWGRKVILSRELQERGIMPIENEIKNGKGVSTSENQRNSTVSNSSTTSSSSWSSCDSLMCGSPSPEPLREVTLSPEEAAQRLLQLQESVCQAVSKLMDFVSSRWRNREHLSQHLKQIRAASEDVANSVTLFLNFALDIRGNAQRLTDSHLQARLQKQLSIVEDSGLIVQKSVDALGDLGWSLDVLAQDLRQSQTPDQLERLVMVARTLPEDLKRLVSIVNANSKLLFRNSPKEPEMPKNTSLPDARKSPSKHDPMQDTQGDEDYVQLQTKTDFETQLQSEAIDTSELEENERKQASEPEPTCADSTRQQPSRPVISRHCRLYFGAIKKAIAVFITSLQEQQPPEKFISHSKLVIMVGQRLIDTLFSEAQIRKDNQEILQKSNHLCALLKQMAVATKKAALHYPDQVAMQEAQDFAKELAQRAHHFRMSLDT